MYPSSDLLASFSRGPAIECGSEAVSDICETASPRGDISTELVARLLDERYRFPSHEHRALCDWLPAVLPECRSWPRGAALVWEDAADPEGSGASHRPLAAGQAVLRVGPHVAREVDGPWVLGLAGEWSGEGAGVPGRADPVLPAGFTAPPGDLFDALALALHQRAASLPGAPPSPGGLTGMRLRQEVADWLQTPAGRRCEGPRPTTPVLEPVDEALIAELATFIRQDLPAALAIRPRTLSPVRHPGPADTPLDQVIHTLRSGGWCDALDHLVPTLLTRLPRSYRCATHALVVDYTGPCGQYGWAHPSGNRIYLSRQPDGTVSFDGWKRRSMTYPAEPDSFLEAALDIPCGALNRRMPGVREELAAIMACNRTLMDLRLALADRRYPCDQEMLLRMCLIHGELTLAGDQLMHPERPQRAVTADDLWRWFEQGSSALDRTETAIAAAGISVVDAYRLASPLRPTRAGNVLMGAPVAFLRRESYGGVQLLEQKLPELTYACQSFCRLEEYLCTSHRHLASLFPAALRERAKRFCAEAAAAEQVNLPPGLQGTTLQKP